MNYPNDFINKVIQGDCLELMKQLPENSVDSVVTDPPYCLSTSKRFGESDWDKEEYKSNELKNGGSVYTRAIKGFMGNEWDNDIAFKMDVWRECLRVLKPGGYLLSFGGSRTYHRMACAIEDAGFEVRDMIEWVYGSGFPKSLNIGKAVDKLRGNEREVLIERRFGGRNGNSSTAGASNGGQQGGYNLKDNRDKTKGTSEWEGWGTALKPAHEPIVVARKPLSEKTVVENVLKWGTGGINIDGSRIDFKNKEDYDESMNKNQHKNYTPSGRFPANLILDEEAGKSLGNASRFFYCAKAGKNERNYGLDDFEEKIGGGLNATVYGDSRTGNIIIQKNNHPTVKPISLMEYLVKLVTPSNGIVLDPFIGSGTTGIACVNNSFKFIGFEKELDYAKIAEARIKPFLEQRKLSEEVFGGVKP